MATPEDAILQGIMQKIAGRLNMPNGASEPEPVPVTPTLSETDKVKAITSIISESYAMPNVPEPVRRRCAKRRIEAEFGKESATKFLRGRKRGKVPAPAAETEQAPPLSTEPPAPTPTEPPPPAAEAVSVDTPVLKLNSEISKILSTAMPQQ